MKTILLFLLVGGGAAAAHASGEMTLTGSFGRGKDTPNKALKAVLTPAGADTWKVAWEAEWKEKPVHYNGEIKGDIQNGAFTGTGASKDGKRTWRLEGKAENGVLTFDHFETTDGREGRTGSAVLKP